MPKYVINGMFMTQQVTGLQRYAYEMCLALDQLLDNKHVVMLVPERFTGNDDIFKNIKIKRYGNKKGIIWEQIDLRKYLRKTKSTCINFCNVTPLFVNPGITAVHDLMFKLFPEWFTTLRNKLSCIWHTFQADYALKNERWILCTSYFTKGVLEKEYPCTVGKVCVTPVGWQHVSRFRENKDWESVYPFLKPGEFFFSMATRAKNKNGQWLIDSAKRNPDQVYAIAGRSYEPESTNIPKNVYLLGYVSDEDVCSLMKNCKAFICPSFYEGFGDPPLEALALGTSIIVSNQSALPEVFESAAHYIDPYNADIDLDLLLQEPVESAQTVLDKYSWDKSAKILYKLMYDRKLNQNGVKNEIKI